MTVGKLHLLCPICGSSYRAKPSQIENGRGRHCSPKCQYVSNSRPKRTDLELLESLIPNESGCLLWPGSKNKAGYGLTPYKHIRGETLVHRFFWRLLKGPIPLGLKVLHQCDVRACCNVDHLFLGTQQDNIKDMVEKGRTRRWGHETLTVHQRREIAQRRINGERRDKLAAEFKISSSYILNIVKNFGVGLSPQLEDLHSLMRSGDVP